MYVRALFTFGYGRVDISDLRLGDTPLSAYDEVEYEIREGTSADEPVTLYPRQVIEEALNVELTRPFPRADDGEILYSEGAQETPVVRYSASDAAELRVIFSFPSGLYVVDDSGNVGAFNAPYRIRQRPEGGSEWLLVTTIDLVAENRTQFFRQFTWSPPYRGRW